MWGGGGKKAEKWRGAACGAGCGGLLKSFTRGKNEGDRSLLDLFLFEIKLLCLVV